MKKVRDGSDQDEGWALGKQGHPVNIKYVFCHSLKVQGPRVCKKICRNSGSSSFQIPYHSTNHHCCVDHHKDNQMFWSTQTFPRCLNQAIPAFEFLNVRRVSIEVLQHSYDLYTFSCAHEQLLNIQLMREGQILLPRCFSNSEYSCCFWRMTGPHSDKSFCFLDIISSNFAEVSCFWSVGCFIFSFTESRIFLESTISFYQLPICIVSNLQ